MDGLGRLVGWIVDRVVHWPFLTTSVALVSFVFMGLAYLQLEPRYRLADQVPDREQALGATARLDQKLTGANPVHIMIEWKSGASLYSPGPMEVIAKTHEVLEKVAGLGNVWSLESLRRWLKEAGDDRPETVEKYVGYLPEHLVRQFIAKEGNAVLVTGRLPDVDSSRILPVVEKIDRALDVVRKQHPDFRISVTGLPAMAARNSARMISQLNEALPLCVAFAAVLLAIAFRSVFVGLVSLLPGLYPVVASGAILWALGGGLEFASVVALLVVFGLADRRADPLLQPIEPRGAQRTARRSGHPQCARAGGTRHHSDHTGVGLRARRDGVLRPALPAHVRIRVRHDAGRLAAGRSRVPARPHHARAQGVEARGGGLSPRWGTAPRE